MKRLSSAALPRKKVVSKSRDWSKKLEEFRMGESEKKKERIKKRKKPSSFKNRRKDHLLCKL